MKKSLDFQQQIGDNKIMYYKIKGRYDAPFSDVETIDIGMETLDVARQMLAEYRMAFGPGWGSLWIEDNRGRRVS
jgi:hypothetical protein